MKRHTIYATSIIIALFLLMSCGGRKESHGDIPDGLKEILEGQDDSDRYGNPLDKAPDSGCTRMKVRNVGAFSKVFNDSNHIHLAEAHKNGIALITDASTAWNNGRGLVEIRSNRLYFVDRLTHSYPFLTPAAAELLEEIGTRFADSLQARGGGAYRPKITSVTRTPMTVGKLRRVNRNATEESAHRHGTTFDISYSKFACDDSTGVRRTFEDLKNLLAEILRDLREEKRCYVKHERKQACFHITAIETNETDL